MYAMFCPVWLVAIDAPDPRCTKLASGTASKPLLSEDVPLVEFNNSCCCAPLD